MSKRKCLSNMRKLFYYIVVATLMLLPKLVTGQVERADDITIDLARSFSKEIFITNGIPYLQPLVEGVNAASNSAFFNSAYVPKKVDKPYFKISFVGMMGIVPNNKKTYIPALPTAEFSLDELSKYVDFSLTPPGISNIKDTVGLLSYAFKVYAGQGVKTGAITPPETAPTVLGNGKSVLIIPRNVLDSLVRSYPDILGKPLFEYFDDSLQANILNVISQFPEYYTLPEGANLSTIMLGVPQFEIGSFMGTEMLLRFIPPVNWGETIGDFAFWGIGLKHSISQYFPKRWFDMAIQGIYQGTYLKNEVGVTNAEITANGNIWSANLQMSKHFEGILDIYGGFSYDLININSNYNFVLPVEVQIQLGLREVKQVGTDPDGNPIFEVQPPSPEYPGDTEIQNMNLILSDSQFKATLGLSKQFLNMKLFLEYNFGKFDVFAGGIQVLL